MRKRLQVDTDKCTGCGMCQIICAFIKNGRLEPSLARMKVWRDEPRGLFVPMVCQQCDNPPCAQVCLMNIIDKDIDSGITKRRLEGCIDCRLCQTVCPFEACRYNYLEKAVVNCDLCGGDPQCVKFCAFGAIQFIDLEDPLVTKRICQAARLAE